jgi:hypothetical protein
MRFLKPLFFVGIVIMAVLACGVGNDVSTMPAVNASIETLTLPPSIIPRQGHSPIPTATFLLPTLETLTSPAWVIDFSNPILMALDGQRPDIHDEFLNFGQGWFYFIPDSPKGPYYAHIENESLLIKLPAENEDKDYWVYNPKLTRRNFVLSFDLQFEETQPEDTVRFQFDQTADQSVAFDLSKNKTWKLHWGPLVDRHSTTGTFDYFAPERITVLVIAQGKECAVYLNDVPLSYLDNCRSEPIARPSPWAVTFHMLAEPGHVAAATIDNLKLWDLDKVISLPEKK